jgi:hypothetical protein
MAGNERFERQHANLVLIARLGQALVRARAVPLAAWPSKLPSVMFKQVIWVALRLSVNAAAAVFILGFAVLGPYGVAWRILLVLAACGAAIAAAASFIKLRAAIRDRDIANPS